MAAPFSWQDAGIPTPGTLEGPKNNLKDRCHLRTNAKVMRWLVFRAVLLYPPKRPHGGKNR